MSPRQYEAFRAAVETLIAADQQVSLFEYALGCVLERHLAPNFRRTRTAPRPVSSTQLVTLAAGVLSLLAREGNPSEEAASAAFAAGMRVLGEQETSARLMQPFPLTMLYSFLQALEGASLEDKRRIVNACAACILADARVTIREGELLRAICAALDCPMPPLVPAEQATSEVERDDG
jgi:hypothetical protein